MQHLSDLDELLQHVRSSYVRDYVKEAITSYRAGAYHAAVTTTWVAVCVDIIDKIKELASQGDGAAAELSQQIERIQDSGNTQQMLEFEDQILDHACDKLEFITPLEKKHLQRLKEDRNICAHPTFQKDGKHFDISPENARLHIVQASNLLFVQSPTMSKAQVNALYELILSETFPEDDEKAFTVLSSERYMGRAKDTVPRNVLLMILKRVFVNDESVDATLAYQMFAAINAISRLYPEISRDLIADKLNALMAAADTKKIRRIYPLLMKCPQLWKAIEAEIRERVISLISRLSSSDIIRFDVPKCSDVLAAFREPLSDAVGALEAKEKWKVIDSCPAFTFKKMAIDIFVNSGSFASAYENGVDNLLPHSKYFDLADLQAILDGSIENGVRNRINQVLHAGGIDSVFVKLFESSKERIQGHEDVWSAFFERVNPHQRQNLSELQTLLEADGLFVPAAEEAETADGEGADVEQEQG